MREIWRPRLELLAAKFGDRVEVTPRIDPSSREATFAFRSKLAKVDLKFTAHTDRDVHKVVLSYDLEIIPILMNFTHHAELEFPLGSVDKEAAGKWIDERIVDFVRTYLAMGDNEWYLKDQMVEDPILHIRFPKQAAGATLEVGGKTIYFVAEETRREYEDQQAKGK